MPLRQTHLTAGDAGDIWVQGLNLLAHVHRSRVYEVRDISAPHGSVRATYRDPTGTTWWIMVATIIRFDNGRFAEFPLPKEVANLSRRTWRLIPDFHVEVEGTPRKLHAIVRNEIFRIAAEALRNAFRHASAHRVEVAVRYDEQQLTLNIRDDAKGISSEVLEARGRAGHWGLQGMRERARRIGAQLEIWSRPETGTELELHIPGANAYQFWRAHARWFWFRPSKQVDP